MPLSVGTDSYVTLLEADTYFTKRPHSSAWNLNDVAASGSLLFSGNPSDGDTVTLDGTVFTFKVTPVSDDDVEIGVDLGTTIDNLIAEDNLSNKSTYINVSDTTLTITHVAVGTIGNKYAVEWNFASETIDFNSGGASTTGSDNLSGGTSFRSDTEKEESLRISTMHLDYSYSFMGFPTDSVQSLSWPREGISDKNGNVVDETIVPQEVKDAQCELALQWIQADQLTPPGTFMTGDDSDYMSGGVKRKKLGDLEIEYDTKNGYLFALSSGQMPEKTYPLVDLKLRYFIQRSSSNPFSRMSI